MSGENDSMTSDLVQFLRDRLHADEQVALAASGNTVIGSRETGWKPSPAGDEWETHRTDCDEDELLVALRPGLPRPPDVMSGMWGAIVDFKPEFEDRGTASPLPQFQHAARHDPARVLADVAAKRLALEHYEDVRQHTLYGVEAYTLAAGTVERQLKFMALPYAGHPDYRQEWRP